MVYVYLEPVRPNNIYQGLTNFNAQNKFYKDISIAKSLLSEEMFKFSNIVQVQGETKSNTEKIFLMEEK